MSRNSSPPERGDGGQISTTRQKASACRRDAGEHEESARRPPYSRIVTPASVACSTIVLVDPNADRLQTLQSLCLNLVRERGSGVSIEAHTDRTGVLDGAIVEVTVEQRIEGRLGDLGWAPVTDGVYPLEIPELRRDATPVWTGPVVLPEPGSSRPFRLVIREYEQHLFMATDRATENKTVRRLVYADILEL